MTSPSTPVFADLHLLTVLAQTRSYTQAARRLGISKASVSMRIAELERAAGVPLVRRTTRSVGLTEAGQQLADETQSAFTRIEQSFASIKDLAGSPRGLVRITAPVALGRQHVAPTLAPFLKNYPDIRLELDLTDRFVNLAQEGFDLAIRHTQSPPETHVAWRLCGSASMLVASADYLRARGGLTHPSELAGHACLAYLRDAASQSWTFEKEGTRKPERVVVAVSGALRANNSEVLREAVLAGLGIGLLPDFSAVGHLATGELVPLLPQWRPLGFFGDAIYAIRPWSAQVPLAVQCVVGHLRKSFMKGFSMEAQPAPRFPALVDAINDMSVIYFTYHGKRRVVQPQCYGIGTKGHELLRGYEPARAGKNKEPLYTVAEMSDLSVGDQHFSKPGPNYELNDSAMVVVFAQLEPVHHF